MPRYDVVGLGRCSLDYLAIVEEYPAADRKIEALYSAEDGGGPTATALVTLARLGARTLFVGHVGSDARGRLMVAQLQREGIDTSHMVVEEGKRSQYSHVIVERPTGKRTIVYVPGGHYQLRVDELDRQAITSGRILHLDGYQKEASIATARWAREAGMKVMLDAGSVRPGMEILADLADYLVTSETFAHDFTAETSIERAARKMLGAHTRAVVVTTGDKGGFCVTHGDEFSYPALQVDVVDTTGAGDVFHGAFDYGILEGWDLRRVLRFASAVAALKCRSLGGRAGIPSLEETKRFLEGS